VGAFRVGGIEILLTLRSERHSWPVGTDCEWLLFGQLQFLQLAEKNGKREVFAACGNAKCYRTCASECMLLVRIREVRWPILFAPG